MGIDSKKDLIHQLYEEVIGVTEEEKESRYVRSTGTLLGDPERFEKEREEKMQRIEKNDDPWSKLDLHPSDVK